MKRWLELQCAIDMAIWLYHILPPLVNFPIGNFSNYVVFLHVYQHSMRVFQAARIVGTHRGFPICFPTQSIEAY